MKIEKISDTQIRCTLNKEDLIDRELRISELAYGSDKAKQLFRDMMQQAAYEFGFEAEDIPLMIEATPISADCLVLVITKVEDPDELDTRFSNFTPYAQQEQEEEDNDEDEDGAYADEILNCFEHLGELLGKREKENPSESESKPKKDKSSSKKEVPLQPIQIPTNLTKIYGFSNISELTQLAKIINPFYHGVNMLFKDPHTKKFYLVLQISQHTPEEFNKVCNMVSEFGKSERTNYATLSYYREHYELILAHDAILHLANL